MNILLITSPAPKIAPFSTSEKRPPIGIGFLISVLKSNGHRVFFVDNYLHLQNELGKNFLNRERIDFIGIHANTICYQNTLQTLENLQRLRSKKKWGGKIVVGGPHTSVGLDTIPDFVDYIVIGEGEISLLEIVSGKESSRVVYGKKVDDLDSLPFPAWEEFIWRQYDWTYNLISKAPVYTFNTSRGCPFNCRFCSVGAIWGKTYRTMSAERIVSDIEYMIKYYGLAAAYFREDHFTLNKKRTLAFCERLLKKKLNIEWVCESRIDDFDDEEYVKLLARAGCRALYIGVESGSSRMLEFFRKGETIDQFIVAFDLLKKYGIKTYASFLVGTPTETEKDLQMTYKLIDRIRPDSLFFNIYTGLPGSELYDLVKEQNLFEYEDKNSVLYLEGHNERVDQFYNGNPYFKIPSPDLKAKIFRYEIKQFFKKGLRDFRPLISTLIARK